TYGKDVLDGVEGFWLRGGQRGEVFLRALEPVRRMTFRLTCRGAPDHVQIGVGGRWTRLTIPPGETAEASFEPGRGFVYKDSFVHVLRFRSTGSTAQRGIFVSIALDVD